MEYYSDDRNDAGVKVETFILAPPTHPPLHHPYLDHPEEDSIEETLDGIQKLFQSGRFKRVRVG